MIPDHFNTDFSLSVAQEIERKFLVSSDAYRSEAVSSSRIRQGYICYDRGRTVRVRLRDDKGYLTIKGPSKDGGLSRFEWEKEIPFEEAMELLALSATPIIDKTRYLVPSGDHMFEVDEFYGDNEGLVIAEVELMSVDDDFLKPEFVGKEVTGDRRYYNSSLTLYPFKDWKP